MPLRLLLTLITVLHVNTVYAHNSVTGSRDNCQYNGPEFVNQSSAQIISMPLRNVSINCTVKFKNSSLASTAGAQWERWPQGETKSVYAHSFSAGNNFTVQLSLRNITSLDQADYTLLVNYSENCSMFVCANISLIVKEECRGPMPEPITQEKVTVTASPDKTLVKLVANFSGDPIDKNYRIVWSHNSIPDLRFSGIRDKYIIRCRMTSNCAFAEELEIHNISKMDSGVYTARAHGNGNTGNMTYFEVIIANNRDEKAVLSLYSIGIVVTVLLLILAVCIGAVYTYKKKRKSSSSSYEVLRLTEQEEMDQREVAPRTTPGTPARLRLTEQEEVDQREVAPTITPGTPIRPRVTEQEEVDQREVAPTITPGTPIRPRVTEQEEVDQREVAPTITPGAVARKGKGLLVLYCKQELDKDKVEDLLEILGHCSGVVPHIDFNVEELPDNWNRWLEEQIMLCCYVLLICTRPLLKALTGRNTLVRMFLGNYYSNSIIDCIDPSKVIPVFINGPEDQDLIPKRLHDRKCFRLDLMHLLNAKQGNKDSLQDLIGSNPDFIAFKELFELLQK